MNKMFKACLIWSYGFFCLANPYCSVSSNVFSISASTSLDFFHYKCQLLSVTVLHDKDV
jgi:hypothetical protein